MGSHSGKIAGLILNSPKILENSHSQLSKNSLRTLILILNSLENPWDISFSISTLSTLTLAEVWRIVQKYIFLLFLASLCIVQHWILDKILVGILLDPRIPSFYPHAKKLLDWVGDFDIEKTQKKLQYNA